jgi:hypothetical protein
MSPDRGSHLGLAPVRTGSGRQVPPRQRSELRGARPSARIGLGLALALGSLGSCGSLTHQMWNDGLAKKHWELIDDEVDATCVAHASTESAAELTLAAAEPLLSSGWSGVFGGTIPPGSRSLVLRGDPEEVARARAILGGAAEVTNARAVIVKVRTDAGDRCAACLAPALGPAPHRRSGAVVAAVRAAGVGRARRGDGRRRRGPGSGVAAPGAAARVAGHPWATWFDPRGERTLASRLEAVCSSDGLPCARDADLERALAESDFATLRGLWLRIATRTARETKELVVRADVLCVASLADCTPTVHGLAWHSQTRWTPSLEAVVVADSRAGSLPIHGVQLSFQHRELVHGQGLGTFAKALLTPLTVTADVATLFLAMGLWEAAFHDDREWDWDDASHRFVPGRSGACKQR